MVIKTCKLLIFSLVFSLGIGSPERGLAQTDKIASAEESDPGTLGWMQGFPPASDKLIMQPQSDYFSFPKLRWTVCHFRELLPTEQVSRNFISGRVLSPDEKVEIIATSEANLARKLQAAIANPENFISFCYCSIFEQCWLADSRQDMQDPESVEECPDFADDTFRN